MQEEIETNPGNQGRKCPGCAVLLHAIQALRCKFCRGKIEINMFGVDLGIRWIRIDLDKEDRED